MGSNTSQVRVSDVGAAFLQRQQAALLVVGSGSTATVLVNIHSSESVVLKDFSEEWLRDREQEAYARVQLAKGETYDPFVFNVCRLATVHTTPMEHHPFPLCITPACPLGTLEHYLAHSSTLDPVAVDHLCNDVLTGMNTLHTAGVLHLDIKSDNILVAVAEDTDADARVRALHADLGLWEPAPPGPESTSHYLLEHTRDSYYHHPQPRMQISEKADEFAALWVLLEIVDSKLFRYSHTMSHTGFPSETNNVWQRVSRHCRSIHGRQKRDIAKKGECGSCECSDGRDCQAREAGGGEISARFGHDTSEMA